MIGSVEAWPWATVCRNESGPLLEVELELATPEMVWRPDLSGSEKGSLQALVQHWLRSFLEVGGCLHFIALGGISPALSHALLQAATAGMF